jgi:hypothetical protein
MGHFSTGLDKRIDSSFGYRPELQDRIPDDGVVSEVTGSSIMRFRAAQRLSVSPSFSLDSPVTAWESYWPETEMIS